MPASIVPNMEYLHDAEVRELRLSIAESGDRKLQLDVRCDPECGYDEWNDKYLCIEFADPLIVHGDLFGHMANVETLNSIDFEITPRVAASIAKLREFGLPAPKHVLSLSFHSGSNLEIACQDVKLVVAE